MSMLEARHCYNLCSHGKSKLRLMRRTRQWKSYLNVLCNVVLVIDSKVRGGPQAELKAPSQTLLHTEHLQQQAQMSSTLCAWLQLASLSKKIVSLWIIYMVSRFCFQFQEGEHPYPSDAAYNSFGKPLVPCQSTGTRVYHRCRLHRQ